ncbi:hypothetical protein QO006_003575 [Deinococcus enclensis]|uniref:Uncharacterized protein n=1 Tax=Deinococcus enclensis TaxID=1049582 RepID=A0ABT9MHN8_9DEIO|nr:hypothetical protein [Deinococcus enclensis]
MWTLYDPPEDQEPRPARPEPASPDLEAAPDAPRPSGCPHCATLLHDACGCRP